MTALEAKAVRVELYGGLETWVGVVRDGPDGPARDWRTFWSEPFARAWAVGRRLRLLRDGETPRTDGHQTPLLSPSVGGRPEGSGPLPSPP